MHMCVRLAQPAPKHIHDESCVMFACFECFRRSAPLIRRALRTGPVGETLSPSAAAQISSSLLLSSTACQGEGVSVRAAGGVVRMRLKCLDGPCARR
jgi:hypothetical protein